MSQSSEAALAGRTMLVTGGSSGIGRAIALAAARAGADVALTYRGNDAGAREVERDIAALGRKAAVLQLDLADDASIAAIGPAARDALGGRVDAWVNNAGADIVTGDAARLPKMERLDIVLRVDLRGTMAASWHAVEMMKTQPDGGVIINMSWDHVLTGMPGTTQEIFSGVKGGILSFSKSLARSAAPRVRVNVLAPGWIETSFGENADKDWYKEIAESTPLKRWGRPEDVAGAAVFLASPAAAFLTGQTLLVGGGLVM